MLHHESDRESSGRFASGRYVLTLPPGLFDLTADHQPTPPTLAPKKRHAERSPGQQLAFLAED
jgi:hypothetical protein